MFSFKRFPLKRVSLLKQWEAFIQKQRGEDWHASRWSSLCSRHFREDDFRSLNERRTLKKTAVPSVLAENEKKVDETRNKPTRKRSEKIVNTYEDTREKEFKEILAIKERLEDTVINATSTILSLPKTNCRLCGILSTPSANFMDNYELYGLLQKCFPTINIQQEDALPKVVCSFCHKNLEEFGSFVDRVWTAQTELHRKFRTKTVEKPLKIKQEPLVRVKQEEAESGYEERQDNSGFGGVNEDYDGATDGGAHEDGDDQKFEFCDFPMINDCDIMEIINLDDPFINIPDDDNTTTQNEDEELLQKPTYEPMLSYMPTAHELLQSHLLMEEHNYAYIDAEEFKEERQIYKTEKSDNEERLQDCCAANAPEEQRQQSSAIAFSTETHFEPQHHTTTFIENTIDAPDPKASSFEKRALKPIVTSVSAIQQPIKSSSNGIVVLNESIVKSGCGFQLHACMVCHLKYFSVESLKQHYTQTHGTPMVSVPGENIPLEKITQNTCKMEKEFTESTMENHRQKFDDKVLREESGFKESEKENLKETKTEEPDNFAEKSIHEKQNMYQNKVGEIKNHVHEQFLKTNSHETPQHILRSDDERAYAKDSVGDQQQLHEDNLSRAVVATSLKNNKKYRLKASTKSRKTQNVSLNAMANQYLQLRKLYQKLQKKCTNLEQNVEQLQSLPITTVPAKRTKSTPKCNQNIIKSKPLPPAKVDFTCLECSKTFSNSNSLRQHKITHTEERKHHCSLCQRSFKRRNGLLQHLKGFHLQVKPFSCPVCKHCYALKCDMLRCKHSTLRNIHPAERLKSRVVMKKCEK